MTRGARILTLLQMSLASGTRLGVYQVVGPLGAGGMGEVYRATDTRLGRDVAIKILPEAFAQDAERVARFDREAQTLAALNHPNIAQIHGIEESPSTGSGQAGSVRALVMELVDGDDLAQRIARGALPIEDALAIAMQVAGALETAHEAGIIHRDLKPANIKVRPDGTVKVLDFGLAKALAPASSSGAVTNDPHLSPTFTSPALTQMGVILGTAAYMAPEQAKGKPVGRRADVWAFGCVLFEMLTARRAFPGEDVTDTLAAIVRGEPEWSALPEGLPDGVRRLLRRMLQKDATKRLDSMAVVRLEIEDARHGSGEVMPIAVPPGHVSRARTFVIGTVLVVAALLAGVAAAWRFASPDALPVTRLSITPPNGTVLQTETNHHDLAILPNGGGLIYWNRTGTDNQIVVRRFDAFDGMPLPSLPEGARGMIVSPDARWIAFQAGGTAGSDATLAKMPVTGGAATTIGPIDGNLRGASWGEDDTILFATARVATGLQRIRAAGGAPETVTIPDRAKGEVDHRWPHLLPGGTHALFALVRVDGTTDIALADLGARSWRVLVRDGTMPRYAGGVLFYGDKGALRAVRFDLDRFDLIGEPVPLPYDPITKESGAVDYDVAPDGTLVFRPGGAQASRLNLAWVGGTGAVTPVKVETRPYRGLRVSPDGRQVAVTLETELDLSLWLVDLDRGTVTRLTPPGYSVMSSGASYGWRPDGRALAVPLWHLDPAANPPGLFLVSSTGTAPPRRLTQPPSGVRHTSVAWTQDGETLLFTKVESDRPHLMRMRIGGEIEPLLAGAGAPALSPDGRWLAYVSDESGLRDIYVRPYPNVDDDRVVISAGGGTLPTWTRDGRELLYISLDRHLMAVEVSPGAGRPFGAPERRMALQSETFTYGISPDGTRVLTTVRPESTGGVPNEFRVVFNLLAEVKPLLK